MHDEGERGARGAALKTKHGNLEHQMMCSSSDLCPLVVRLASMPRFVVARFVVARCINTFRMQIYRRLYVLYYVRHFPKRSTYKFKGQHLLARGKDEKVINVAMTARRTVLQTRGCSAERYRGLTHSTCVCVCVYFIFPASPQQMRPRRKSSTERTLRGPP